MEEILPPFVTKYQLIYMMSLAATLVSSWGLLRIELVFTMVTDTPGGGHWSRDLQELQFTDVCLAVL